MEGGHGVILINTKAGGSNVTMSPGLKTFYVKGFNTVEPFNIPDYNNKQIKSAKTQDLRQTIYWNGNIITGKDGKASVQFFTADKPGVYVGIIKGISVKGDKIFQTFTLLRK